MEITLTRGKVTLVDDADFDWLNQWSWCARPNRWKNSPRITWYACRRKRRSEVGSGPRRNINMHTAILAHYGLPSERCDHEDGNGLNNQKENLRPATAFQNNGNTVRARNNSSGYKGVHFDRVRGKWRAAIGQNNAMRQLGRFDTPKEAAEAYDLAAIALFGNFAKTNAAMGLL